MFIFSSYNNNKTTTKNENKNTNKNVDGDERILSNDTKTYTYTTIQNTHTQKAKDKHDINIEWDRKALDFLVNGYDVNYGARSIKHEVERRVVNQLAVAHEYNLIENGSHILITADLPPSQTELVRSDNENNENCANEKKKKTAEDEEEDEKERKEKKNSTSAASKNYDIRLKRIIKSKHRRGGGFDLQYQDINLRMSSSGKYYINDTKLA